MSSSKSEFIYDKLKNEFYIFKNTGRYQIRPRNKATNSLNYSSRNHGDITIALRALAASCYRPSIASLNR
jgi:hypothetical protein